MMDMMSGFGLLWMLVPLLLWGGLLVLVVWLVIRLFPGLRGGGNPSTNNAEGILKERFARGEIDEEEYERSLRTLREGSSAGSSYEDFVRAERTRRS